MNSAKRASRVQRVQRELLHRTIHASHDAHRYLWSLQLQKTTFQTPHQTRKQSESPRNRKEPNIIKHQISNIIQFHPMPPNFPGLLPKFPKTSPTPRGETQWHSPVEVDPDPNIGCSCGLVHTCWKSGLESLENIYDEYMVDIDPFMENIYGEIIYIYICDMIHMIPFFFWDEDLCPESDEHRWTFDTKISPAIKDFREIRRKTRTLRSSSRWPRSRCSDRSYRRCWPRPSAGWWMEKTLDGRVKSYWNRLQVAIGNRFFGGDKVGDKV